MKLNITYILKYLFTGIQAFVWITFLISLTGCDDIFIPPTSMEAFLRSEIQKPKGELTEDDFISITSLTVSRGCSVYDLDKIELCTNLVKLNIWDNPLDDFSDLSKLPKLNDLSIMSCDIESISFLSSLSNLEDLCLIDNSICDLKPLSNLKKLARLSLAENQIQDTKHLSKLEKLRSLDLSENQIIDIEPLGNLHNLRNIWVNNNQIDNFSVLSKLPNLNLLDLTNNEIKVLPKLSDAEPRVILLANNQINDLKPFENLHFRKSLKANVSLLDLSNNLITDIEPLLSTKYLAKLILTGNPLSDESINEIIPALEAKGIEVIFNANKNQT